MSAAHRPSGVRAVLRYNWPLYLAGAATAAGGWTLGRVLAGGRAGSARGPRRLASLAARAGALTAGGWLLSSTAGTWWVYDRSPLHSFSWLDGLLPGGPGEHLVVSAGLDEASAPLAARYPGTDRLVVDLYDPALMTEGSIRRARHLVPPAPTALAARPGRLPAATAGRDTVFAVFAAHELRRAADREALFAEIARVLRPGGRLVLVEHLRDRPNTVVYGPGAWHFLPRAEWLRLAAGAGLRPEGERRIGVLVVALAFRKEPA